MHVLRLLVAIVLLIVAFVCIIIGISEVRDDLPGSITKFFVAVFLALLSAALILR